MAVGVVEASLIGSAFTCGYLLRLIVCTGYADSKREVDGSLRDKSQALDGPLKENLRFSFFIGRALTTPPCRHPQGVTYPRCLRLMAVGFVEASLIGSAFTCGYLGSPAKVGG